MKDLKILAPKIEKLLISNLWENFEPRHWVSPNIILNELLDKVVLDYSSRISCKPTRRFATHLLGSLTEQERQGFIAKVFKSNLTDEKARQVVGLWGLGNEFLHIGRYSLAAGIFLQAAFTEKNDPLAQAVLLVKAGTAFNNSGWGPNVDYCLANALNLISSAVFRDNKSQNAVALAKCLVHYHLARRELFRDDYTRAEENLELAMMALSSLEDLKEIGITCHIEEIPDFLLLRTRIRRSEMQVLGSGSTDALIALIDTAKKYHQNKLLLRAPFDQHILYQYSLIYRFARKLSKAKDFAEQAFYAVTGLSLPEAMSNPFKDTPDPINTRRIGYCYTLIGEIYLDKGDYDQASKFFELAEQVWTEPHYARGLSRAKRNHAYCLMGMGKNWQDASRLLREAIVHSRGVSDSGGEIRALASKIALHRTMGHLNKVEYYEAELAAAAVNHRHIDKILKATPFPPVPGKDRPDKQAVDLTPYLEESGILGEDPNFIHALERAYSFAKKDFIKIILLEGNTGTGKKTVAEFIHKHSARENGPFYPLKISKYSEDILEDLLFGKRNGRSPTATESSKGLIESSNGGTLFLNDIQKLPITVQKRLLSVIEKGEYTPPGAPNSVKVDFRLICGTQVPIQTLINQGQLEKEFFHTIKGDRIVLPSLCERPRDIQVLGKQFFLKALQREPALGTRINSLSTKAWQLLSSYEWPENAKELENFMVKIVSHLALEDDLAPFVSDYGELQMEFVSRVLEDHRSQGDFHSGSQTTVLHTKVPITPEKLKLFFHMKKFKNLKALGEFLVNQYPEYDKTPEALIRRIYRVPEFKQILKERSLR